MFKQISIFVSILYLVGIINSARLSSDTEDVQMFEYQYNLTDNSISNDSINIDRFKSVEWLINKVFNLTNHENSSNYQQAPIHNITNSTEDLIQFGKEMLQFHNNYRKRHCVSALEFDEKLTASAQAYAEKIANTSVFEHSKTPNVGENLWYQWSSEEQGIINGKQPLKTFFSTYTN